MPSPAAALPIFKASSRSVITTNFHGCALQAEGAIRPASIIRSNFSASTGRSLSYARSLWRESTNCRNSLYSILFILNHPADILTYNIKLDIHHTANGKSMEVSMLVSIRNDSHLESIIRRVTYRQADTIHRY